MGTAPAARITQWSKGEYQGATNQQVGMRVCVLLGSRWQLSTYVWSVVMQSHSC
jgi:hypothetical protein